VFVTVASIVAYHRCYRRYPAPIRKQEEDQRFDGRGEIVVAPPPQPLYETVKEAMYAMASSNMNPVYSATPPPPPPRSANNNDDDDEFVAMYMDVGADDKPPPPVLYDTASTAALAGTGPHLYLQPTPYDVASTGGSSGNDDKVLYVAVATSGKSAPVVNPASTGTDDEDVWYAPITTDVATVDYDVASSLFNPDAAGTHYDNAGA
jgi:hypothetical protein